MVVGLIGLVPQTSIQARCPSRCIQIAENEGSYASGLAKYLHSPPTSFVQLRLENATPRIALYYSCYEHEEVPN